MLPPSKDFIELDKTVTALQERLGQAVKMIEDLKLENRELKAELERVKGRSERLEERTETHKSQIDKWDTRLWTLIVGFGTLFVGAILSLASGLIVTLAKK